MIDRDCIISHPQNPIKPTKSKCQTRLLSRLSKKLIFNLHPGNLKGILTDKAGERTTAVANFKGCAVGLVRRRLT